MSPSGCHLLHSSALLSQLLFYSYFCFAPSQQIVKHFFAQTFHPRDMISHAKTCLDYVATEYLFCRYSKLWRHLTRRRGVIQFSHERFLNIDGISGLSMSLCLVRCICILLCVAVFLHMLQLTVGMALMALWTVVYEMTSELSTSNFHILENCTTVSYHIKSLIYCGGFRRLLFSYSSIS